MRELALFAGAGGSIWATKLLGYDMACAVEFEPHRRAMLRARQADGSFNEFPIYDDVATFDGSEWRGRCDLVTAGFPCQPWSAAGKRKGADDERNRWPDTARIIREIRAPVVFVENSPRLRSHPYFEKQILVDLAACGYDVAWRELAARDVGAPHRRNRLWVVAALPDALRDVLRNERRWGCGEARSDRTEPRNDGAQRIMANSDRQRCEEPDGTIAGEEKHAGPTDGRSRMADADEGRSEVERLSEYEPLEGSSGDLVDRRGEGRRGNGAGWWDHDPADGAQSGVGRVVDRMAHRRHRIGAVGDGWVSLCAAVAFVLLVRELLAARERRSATTAN